MRKANEYPTWMLALVMTSMGFGLAAIVILACTALYWAVNYFGPIALAIFSLVMMALLFFLAAAVAGNVIKA